MFRQLEVLPSSIDYNYTDIFITIFDTSGWDQIRNFLNTRLIRYSIDNAQTVSNNFHL